MIIRLRDLSTFKYKYIILYKYSYSRFQLRRGKQISKMRLPSSCLRDSMTRFSNCGWWPCLIIRAVIRPDASKRRSVRRRRQYTLFPFLFCNYSIAIAITRTSSAGSLQFLYCICAILCCFERHASNKEASLRNGS